MINSLPLPYWILSVLMIKENCALELELFLNFAQQQKHFMDVWLTLKPETPINSDNL